MPFELVAGRLSDQVLPVDVGAAVEL